MGQRFDRVRGLLTSSAGETGPPQPKQPTFESKLLPPGTADRKRELFHRGAVTAMLFISTVSVAATTTIEKTPAVISLDSDAAAIAIGTGDGSRFAFEGYGDDTAAAENMAQTRLAEALPGDIDSERIITSDECVAVVYDRTDSPSARMGIAEAAIRTDAVSAAFRAVGITKPGGPEADGLKVALACAERGSMELPLGDAANLLGGWSSTLTSQWQLLKAKGWKFTWGEEGKGTYASWDRREIVLDRTLEKSPRSAVDAFAHETGHAMSEDSKRDRTGKYCFRIAMNNEGKAELNSMRVRAEISAVEGTANNMKEPYADAYQRYADSGFDPVVRDKEAVAIGVIFEDYHPSTRPELTYRQHYSNCDTRALSVVDTFAEALQNALVAMGWISYIEARQGASGLTRPYRRRRN